MIVPSWGLTCLLSPLCGQAGVFVMWKIGLNSLLGATEAIENWEEVKRGRIAKGLKNSCTSWERGFSCRKSCGGWCPHLLQVLLFQRWLNHIAHFTWNQKSPFEVKPKEQILGADSSLVWYLRIPTELRVWFWLFFLFCPLRLLEGKEPSKQYKTDACGQPDDLWCYILKLGFT